MNLVLFSIYLFTSRNIPVYTCFTRNIFYFPNNIKLYKRHLYSNSIHKLENFSSKMIGELHGESDEFESNVGIQTYISSTNGIQGILKQRYSDFIVREVSKSNQVTYLNALNALDIDKKYFSSPVNSSSESMNRDEIITTVMKELHEIESLEFIKPIDEVKEYLQKVLDKDSECESELVAFICKDKLTRTKFHQLFKKYVVTHIDTATVDNGNVSTGVLKLVAKFKSKRETNDKKRAREAWPTDIPNYLHFTMLKENIDTMTALNILSKNLHLKDSSIGYAGTKDKRAITTQRCSIFRGKPNNVARINHLTFPFIRVGDFSYENHNLTLGDLSGNRFEIVLRNITSPIEEITKTCESIQTYGFINYYGLQRFGKGAANARSHELGREIYKSNWKAVCDMLFATREWEKDDIKLMKEYYFKGDFSNALISTPSRLYLEKLVLQGLVNSKNQYFNAYSRAPKHVRILCTHAYQSYLWNMATSKRIMKFGLECFEGDLVALNGSLLDSADITNETEGDIETSETINQVNEESDSKIKRVDDSAIVDDNEFQRQKYANTSDFIHVVTKEDIEQKKFTINDVILPLPGSLSIYPTNEIGKYYQELMALDGISSSTFETCHPQYRTMGTYRRILQFAKDFEWDVVTYSHVDEEISKSEVLTLRSNHDMPENPKSDILDSQGEFKALIVKFTIPSGSYATMLIRELTKASTDTLYQSQLTAASKTV